MRSDPQWLDGAVRRIVAPNRDRGAGVAGWIDALDVACTAVRLEGATPGLERLEIWVDRHQRDVRELVTARGDTALEIVLLDERPEQADILYVGAAAEELDDETLLALLDGVDRVVWTSDVDAPIPATASPPPAALPHAARADVERLLDRFFGFPRFRDGQWDIVSSVLAGRSTLGVLPTGAGKSVCFQLPALLQPGVTLVVSPLTSLMDDQVANLRSVGLDFAGRVHSAAPDPEVEQELRRLSAGDYKLFYVSPERFHSERFLQQLASLRVAVPLFVVDEAHLASEWGHDFRPSYLTLPDAHRAIAPEAPVVLLTATAPPQIRRDLAGIFHETPLTAVLPDTFDRPELSFRVCAVEDDREREELLLDLVERDIPESLGFRDVRALHQLGDDAVQHGGLVFAPWGRPGPWRPPIRVPHLARRLADRGIPNAEHRGSTEEVDRAAANRLAQERFKRNELPVIVATKGFGTGVDKPDIRYVVHADLPGSLEALYQEAGRAGRDGRDARSVALWRPRLEACQPNGAPRCTVGRRCPYGLEEPCSFGVQAGLRVANQPGAAAETEGSLSLWRRYFAGRGPQVDVPRSAQVAPLSRVEVLDRTPAILGRLHALALCGEPAAGPTERAMWVETVPFDPARVQERLDSLRPGARADGPSDEGFVIAAVRAAFDLELREAEDHAAVWALHLRGSAGRAVVPCAPSALYDNARPHVERMLARLTSLGVVTRYRYRGLRHWCVTLADAQPVAALQARLDAALGRYGLPPSDPLPEAPSAAVEEALVRLIRAWYQTVAAQSWEMLETLEAFARARDCRRQRIATYMNERSAPIPAPCGHCDNCGIERLGEVGAVTVDEALRQRFAALDLAFDAMLEAPEDLALADVVVAAARAAGGASVVRDRAARHLERAPFDAAPRLAAALACDDLGEVDVAVRHLRLLLERLAQGDVSRLESAIEAAPLRALAVLQREGDGFLGALGAVDRTVVRYRMALRCDGDAAARVLLHAIESGVQDGGGDVARAGDGAGAGAGAAGGGGVARRGGGRARCASCGGHGRGAGAGGRGVRAAGRGVGGGRGDAEDAVVRARGAGGGHRELGRADAADGPRSRRSGAATRRSGGWGTCRPSRRRCGIGSTGSRTVGGSASAGEGGTMSLAKRLPHDPVGLHRRVAPPPRLPRRDRVGRPVAPQGHGPGGAGRTERSHRRQLRRSGPLGAHDGGRLRVLAGDQPDGGGRVLGADVVVGHGLRGVGAGRQLDGPGADGAGGGGPGDEPVVHRAPPPPRCVHGALRRGGAEPRGVVCSDGASVRRSRRSIPAAGGTSRRCGTRSAGSWSTCSWRRRSERARAAAGRAAASRSRRRCGRRRAAWRSAGSASATRCWAWRTAVCAGPGWWRCGPWCVRSCGW
ncbi:MAG: DEAD/DEAH box helicase [Myxococcota bacterium]